MPGNAEEPRGAPGGNNVRAHPSPPPKPGMGLGGGRPLFRASLGRAEVLLPPAGSFKERKLRGESGLPRPNSSRYPIPRQSPISPVYSRPLYYSTSCTWAGQSWYSRSLQNRRKIVKEVCEPTSSRGRTMKLSRTHLGETGFNELGEWLRERER